MNELITVNFETQTVSARDLYDLLSQENGVKGTERFSKWFERYSNYGFVQGEDFSTPNKKVRVQVEGNREVQREIEDYDLSVDMAKQICMLQRTEKGKQLRQYLIDLEKAWNTPEQVMARALKVADLTINNLKVENKALLQKIEQDKPKTLFAEAVSASDTSILVRGLAKMIRQNGVQIGEKRLYRWLREHGYICKDSTMPTQKAMEMGLFEIIVRTVEKGNGLPLETKTTKVTGKGQIYFVEKLLLLRPTKERA